MPPEADPFNKFSDSARKVLNGAQRIALGMRQLLNSEHILLSLTVTPGTLSYDILRDNLVSADQIRLLLNMRAVQSHKPGDLSAEAKSIIKRAISVAAVFNHTSVDAEHILMACLSDVKCKGYILLGQLGVDPERVKSQLNSLFRDLAEMDVMIQQKIEQFNQQGKNSPLTKTSTRKRGGQTPAIHYFTADLTRQARKGLLDKVIGRAGEIDRAIHILARKAKNNPVFIGEPGVGKTAIVEGIAQAIASGRAPRNLLNKRLLTLDLPLLVAGTMYRGQFEERVKKLLDEVYRQKNIILFIDEIHNIVGAGSAEGSIDAANILKPALTKGGVRVIGATTLEEYRKYIERDSALERRLQPIVVKEPSSDETKAILRGLRGDYEKFHHVTITNAAINAAVDFAERYINDRYMPDKAIDLIDEACAGVAIAHHSDNSSDEISGADFFARLKEVEQKKRSLVEKEKYDEALKLRLEQQILEQKIASPGKENQPSLGTVDRDQVATVVAKLTNIPMTDLVASDKEKLLKLESTLNGYIIDQFEATRDIAQAIKRNRTGVSDTVRPIGSFIFLGPTGVGKTELVKVLARELYGSQNALVKIDMSEFMERHNISRLVGAPPGYVGYDEAGKLTETIRRKPYSVVLFDEIEKAHPDVFNLLLQILEDGYLTDAQGRRVNFRHTLIVMTSNIGMKEISTFGPIGFNKKSSWQSFDELKEKILQKLKGQLSPEFINRVDRIIVFKTLTDTSFRKIAQLELDKLAARLKKQENVKVQFSGDVAGWIARVGANREFGARPLRRAIQQHIENLLADELLKSQSDKKSTIALTVEDNQIRLKARRQKSAVTAKSYG
ncbi:MAG TPA: ATP-dependent Clp protease ATP-binding subunit [Patescibacteria group bacterium]|nr:ATP-dependent Clp protease ATP-binding subunit [Patescibacteria group bacterium]